jgi:alpha-beta hydrolase superfamily lysophospholipase
MISSGADEIVSVAAQEKICRRVPNCHLVMIPDALHELLIETDAVLEKFWEVFDGFVFSAPQSMRINPPNKRRTSFSRYERHPRL